MPRVLELLRTFGEREARAAVEAARRNAPNTANALHALGVSAGILGDHALAEQYLRSALRRDPRHALVHADLGNSLSHQGNVDAAEVWYRESIRLEPQHAEFHARLGVALSVLERHDEALESLARAQRLAPADAAILVCEANALRAAGERAAAIDCYRRALQLQPDLATAHANLSYVLLAEGQLAAGLEEYEWRFGTPSMAASRRTFRQPTWDGRENLAGKTLLVWGEQGPGDVLVSASALPALRERAPRCIVECMPKLAPLLRRSFPWIEVRAPAPADEPPRGDFDRQIPIGSLFRCLRLSIEDFDAPASSIVPDAANVRRWSEWTSALGGRTRVGISWRSPLVTPQRAPNYTRLAEWRDVLSTPGCAFVNLQTGECRAELDAARSAIETPIHDPPGLDMYDDLDGVAALAAALDLVVSVATTVANISAAVGTTTWQLTWRESPWNTPLVRPLGPRVTLVERASREPWTGALAAVAARLKDFQPFYRRQADT